MAPNMLCLPWFICHAGSQTTVPLLQLKAAHTTQNNSSSLGISTKLKQLNATHVTQHKLCKTGKSTQLIQLLKLNSHNSTEIAQLMQFICISFTHFTSQDGIELNVGF